MRQNDYFKIAIVLILIGCCMVKYLGCNELPPVQEEERLEKVKNTVFVFLEALKKEDISLAARYSSENALESAMAIPVDHIDQFSIHDIDSDKKTAQVSTMINEQHETEVYLLRTNDGWKVNGLIGKESL